LGHKWGFRSPTWTDRSEQLSEQYFREFQRKVSTVGVLEIPVSVEDAREGLRRVSFGLKPAKSRSKDRDIRDSLIWLALIRHAASTGSRVAFISSNKADFSEDGRLHPTLAEEARRERTQIEFYEKVEAFLSAHAERIDFVTEEYLSQELLARDEFKRLLDMTLTDNDSEVYSLIQRYLDDVGRLRSYDYRIRDTSLLSFYILEYGEHTKQVSLDIAIEIECQIVYEPYGGTEPPLDEREGLALQASAVVLANVDEGGEDLTLDEVDEFTIEL
jgi:hypothetical protein